MTAAVSTRVRHIWLPLFLRLELHGVVTLLGVQVSLFFRSHISASVAVYSRRHGGAPRPLAAAMPPLATLSQSHPDMDPDKKKGEER